MTRFLLWLLRLFESDCSRGKHVWDTRFGSFQCVNGVKRHELWRRCQVCFVSKREWGDGGDASGPPTKPGTWEGAA